MITVKKSLNNSMLLVEHDQQEMILFGKGIGFGARPGTQVNAAGIEQVFIPLEHLKSRHYFSLTNTIPVAWFDITHDIIALAQAQYSEKLHSVLFFTLAEHLWFAAERARAGQVIANKLSWEVQRYYQKEYAIGLQARAMVEARFKLALGEDEAVHIAFHLINASGSAGQDTAHQQVQLVNRIAEIVRYKLNRSIDVTSINYNRFITHLRYFAERILAGKISTGAGEDFYQELLKFHPEAMSVAWTIRDYIQEKYQLSLPREELTWLSMHISRLSH